MIPLSDNHTKSNLRKLLSEVQSIAVVGASSNPNRDSYKVMKFLIDYGYEVFPVNPNIVEKNILGKKCFKSLKEIQKNIDMVDVFRDKDFIYEITKEAIEVKANILWTQLGIFDKKAANLGKNAGLKIVMNECPKIILEG